MRILPVGVSGTHLQIGCWNIQRVNGSKMQSNGAQICNCLSKHLRQALTDQAPSIFGILENKTGKNTVVQSISSNLSNINVSIRAVPMGGAPNDEENFILIFNQDVDVLSVSQWKDWQKVFDTTLRANYSAANQQYDSQKMRHSLMHPELAGQPRHVNPVSSQTFRNPILVEARYQDRCGFSVIRTLFLHSPNPSRAGFTGAGDFKIAPYAVTYFESVISQAAGDNIHVIIGDFNLLGQQTGNATFTNRSPGGTTMTHPGSDKQYDRVYVRNGLNAVSDVDLNNISPDMSDHGIVIANVSYGLFSSASAITESIYNGANSAMSALVSAFSSGSPHDAHAPPVSRKRTGSTSLPSGKKYQ